MNILNTDSLAVLIITFLGLSRSITSFLIQQPSNQLRTGRSIIPSTDPLTIRRNVEWKEIPESLNRDLNHSAEDVAIWKSNTLSDIDYDYYEKPVWEPYPTDFSNRSRFMNTHPYVEGNNRSRFLDMGPLYGETFEYPAHDIEDDPECKEWYCVVAIDKADSFKTLREPNMIAHLSWVRASWRAKGMDARVKWDKAILADDLMSTRGNVYYIQAKSLKDAQKFIESDPYQIAGLYEDVKLFRWFHKQKMDLAVDQASFPHLVLTEFKKTQGKNARKDGIHIKHMNYYGALETVYHAGPLQNTKDKTKAVGFVLELAADSVEDVMEIVEKDPYAKAKMYKDIQVMRLLELDVSGRWVNNANRQLHYYNDDIVRENMKEWGLLEPEQDYFYPLHDLMTEEDKERLMGEKMVDDKKSRLVAQYDS